MNAAARPASQDHGRLSSVPPPPPRNALNASCRIRVPEEGSPATNRREPVKQEVRSAGIPRCPRGGEHRVGYLPGAGPDPKSAREDRGCQGIEVRLPSPPRVECLEPLCRLQQEWRSITPPVGSKRDLGAKYVQLGSLQLIEGPRSAVAARRSAASSAPAWRLASAAASARADRSVGSTVIPVDRSIKAAAAANPPRDWGLPSAYLQVHGDVVVRARRGLRPVPGTSVRSAAASVASASARWPHASPPVTPRCRRPSARADDGTPLGSQAQQAVGLGRGRSRRGNAKQFRARDTSTASPVGSAAAKRATSAGTARGASRTVAGKLASKRPVSGNETGKANPPASRAAVYSLEAVRARRAGCRAPQRGSGPAHAHRPGPAAPSAAELEAGPPHASRRRATPGAPRAPRGRPRAANTKAIRPDTRRRATKAIACSDGVEPLRVIDDTERRLLSGEPQADSAPPNRQAAGLGVAPLTSPNATPRAPPLRFRELLDVGQHGRGELLQGLLNGSSISASLPTARSTRKPLAPSVA